MTAEEKRKREREKEVGVLDADVEMEIEAEREKESEREKSRALKGKGVEEEKEGSPDWPSDHDAEEEEEVNQDDERSNKRVKSVGAMDEPTRDGPRLLLDGTAISTGTTTTTVTPISESSSIVKNRPSPKDIQPQDDSDKDEVSENAFDSQRTREEELEKSTVRVKEESPDWDEFEMDEDLLGQVDLVESRTKMNHASVTK